MLFFYIYFLINCVNKFVEDDYGDWGQKFDGTNGTNKKVKFKVHANNPPRPQLLLYNTRNRHGSAYTDLRHE